MLQTLVKMCIPDDGTLILQVKTPSSLNLVYIQIYSAIVNSHCFTFFCQRHPEEILKIQPSHDDRGDADQTRRTEDSRTSW